MSDEKLASKLSCFNYIVPSKRVNLKAAWAREKSVLRKFPLAKAMP